MSRKMKTKISIAEEDCHLSFSHLSKLPGSHTISINEVFKLIIQLCIYTCTLTCFCVKLKLEMNGTMYF